MIVISILTVDAKAEADAFGLSFEVSTYILSALTTAVIFADYRFLARKLDACGIMTCPVLSVISVILSGLGAGVRACAKLAQVSFMTVLRDYPRYLEFDTDGFIDKFTAGYITRGLLLAVIASIGFCVVYFERHPDETVLSEKVRETKRRDASEPPPDGGGSMR